MENLEPFPISLSTSICPSICSIIALTIGSPSHVPFISRVSELFTCQNFSNILWKYFFSIPIPLSSTHTIISSPIFRQLNHTVHHSGVNLFAFHRRLRKTCLSLFSSVVYSNFSKSIEIMKFCRFFSKSDFTSVAVSSNRETISVACMSSSCFHDSIFEMSNISFMRLRSLCELLYTCDRYVFASSFISPASPSNSIEIYHFIDVIGVLSS